MELVLAHLLLPGLNKNMTFSNSGAEWAGSFVTCPEQVMVGPGTGSQSGCVPGTCTARERHG